MGFQDWVSVGLDLKVRCQEEWTWVTSGVSDVHF